MTTKNKGSKRKVWNIKKNGFDTKTSVAEPEWTKIGVVGVDSGTLIVGDPCYLTDDNWSTKDYDKEVCEGMGDYSRQVKYEMGHDGKAVLFSSGFGDGCYEVFAKIKDCKGWGKRVAEVKIVMIAEDDI